VRGWACCWLFVATRLLMFRLDVSCPAGTRELKFWRSCINTLVVAESLRENNVARVLLCCGCEHTLIFDRHHSRVAATLGGS